MKLAPRFPAHLEFMNGMKGACYCQTRACELVNAAVADAVELPDAFGHGAETFFHQVEVKDRFVVVVLLGLDHPD